MTSSPLHRAGSVARTLARFFDVEHRTTAIAYVTSGTTFGVGALTANEIAAIGGLVLAFLTFCVNWYYRHKHFKLAEKRAYSNGDD